MKKITLLCIAFVLMALAILPNAAFAESTDYDGANLCLIDPVAICAIGDNLFVADNVDESSQSVILRFDISGDSPKKPSSFSVSKPIVNLSNVNDQLCVIYADSYELLQFDSSDGNYTVADTHSDINAVDVTYGNYIALNEKVPAQYFIGEDSSLESHLFYTTEYSSGFTYTESVQTKNPVACLEFGEQIYYIYNNGATCKRWNGQKLNTQDIFNKDSHNPFAEGFVPKGMFTYTQSDGTEQLVVFNDSEMYRLDGSDGTLFNIELNLYKGQEAYSTPLIDVTFAQNKLFVLNEKNQVEVFTPSETYENSFVKTAYTIGTETITVNIDAPKTNAFTGFTLAKSTGYPTNIVYKTEFENSIENMLLGDDFPDSFTILDFDGSDEIPYYYVLVGDKFGWITKSSGATNAASDEKIEIINNNVSSDVTFNAKFISGNAVHIYDLPLSESSFTTFQQSLSDPQSAEVLQKFTEKRADGSIVEWYYVAYGENYAQKGFIQTNLVGKFTASGSMDTAGMDVVGYYKINASLFEAVKIYASSDMLASESLHNEAGGEVKLYSGTYVVVVREDGAASFVEIRNDDGTTVYGWINSRYIIGRHGITTNAIVGISILSAAVLLAVVLAIVFASRKKRAKRIRNTEE